MLKKFKAFKDFVKEDKVFQEQIEPKVQALKSFIENKPIDIVKDGKIDQEQVKSYLSYESMVTKEQKELIGPKRYDSIMLSFIESLQGILEMQPTNPFEELTIYSLQDQFKEYVLYLYNIYAMTPEIKE
jgi:hypothetical protein